MVLSAVAALGITVSLSSYHRVTVADRARSVRSPVGPTGVWACRHRRHRLRGRGPRCRWRSVRYATTRRWHDDGAGEQSKGPSAGDAGGPEDAWRTGGDRRHPSAGRQWRNNERRATVITSNRDFNEWPLVFANPLMASATMDRLVHRAVKIVNQGQELPQPSEDVRSTGVSRYHLARRRGLTGRPGAIFLPAPGRSVPRSSHTGPYRHSWPSVTLSCRPSRLPSAANTGRRRRGHPAVPAVDGSRAASASNQMAPSTRTRRSGLIQRSPRITT